jgi:serine protease Do
VAEKEVRVRQSVSRTLVLGRRPWPARPFALWVARAAVVVSLTFCAGTRITGQPTAAAPGVPVAASADASVDLKAMERRAQETLQKVVPSIVAVSGGCGVVVSQDGYVLTAAHVGVRPGRRVTLTFADGRVVRGRTLGSDQGVDAGLMKIDGEGPFPFVPMATSADVPVGTWCLALGYPVSFERGKAPVLRIGRVLGNRPTMLVTDCTIMGGDSGGPLFDLDGNLIGISSRCDDRLTTNIHVPVDCFRAEWDRLLRGEDFNSLRRVVAYLGVDRTEDMDEPRIGRVFPGSGAEKAGVQVGDVVLSFGGTALARYRDLPPLIEQRRPGDEVELEVRRGDQIMKLRAVLGQRED